MADWNLPLASSLYVDVLTYLKLRDIDAITLCFNEPTNIADHSFKYERNLNLFQEYESGTWRNKVLSVLGGGTGATNPNDIRINLGLGSMALQAASAVAITGGTMNGVAITNATALTTATGVGATINGSLVAVTVQASGAGGFIGIGSAITNLNGSAIDRGMVGTAYLGSGAASAATYLRGDRTWSALVVNPSRWTHVFVPTHDVVTLPQADGMSIMYCYGAGQNLHLPSPSQVANPAAPIRILSVQGNTAIYGGYPPGPYTNIAGRPSPFMMPVPYMSIDVVANVNNNEWNVY